MTHLERLSRTLVAIALLASIGLGGAADAHKGSYASGRFALELDGGSAGFVKSVKGGHVRGELAKHELGPSTYQKKHIANTTYAPIEIEVGLGAGQELWDWVRESIDRAFVSRSCAISAIPDDGATPRELRDALITQVEFPALDAKGTQSPLVTLTIDPGADAIGPSVHPYPSPAPGSQAPSTRLEAAPALGFRLELGDLPTSRVSSVGPVTWKRDAETGVAELSDIEVSFSAADAEAWEAWFRSFVLEGRNSDADELQGALVLLGPEGQELVVLDLLHVGILSLTPSPEDVTRVDAELYVEDLGFTYVGEGDGSILVNNTDVGDTYQFADDFDGDGLDPAR